MRRIIRYIAALLILLIAAALGWTSGLNTWSATVGVSVLVGLGTVVGFGPEVYGGLDIDLPGGSGVDFGSGDDDCDRKGG